MNYIFNKCVDLLNWMAGLIGITYEEINVLIFCFIWPAGFVVLIWLALHQRKQIKLLSNEREAL